MKPGIIEEEDYNNLEDAASEWLEMKVRVGQEYQPHVPAGTYGAIQAGPHLLCLHVNEKIDYFVIVHRTSKTVLLSMYIGNMTWPVMLTELDRKGFNWDFTDLASQEASSARWAIYMMQKVIEIGGYAYEYTIDLDNYLPKIDNHLARS